MDQSENFKKKSLWVVNIHISLSCFLYLYTMGIFNTCQQNISYSLNWGENESFYITLFSTFVPIGALIGTTLAGFFISRFGRRLTIMYTDTLYILGSFILVIPLTATFAIGRILTGFCAGIFFTISPIYCSEVTPELMMSKVGPIMVIFDNFGLLVSFTLGLALPSSNFDSDPMNNWWLFMFLFPACVCFYQFIYFKYFWKLDTPQFYLSKGMKELTHQSIALSYTQEGQAEGFRRVEKEILSKLGSNEEKSEFCKFFRQPRFFKMMRVGISLALINQFSGMAAIIFYSTKIFNELGGGLSLSRLLTVIMGIVNLFSAVLSIILLKYFGRKTLIVSGQILLFFDLLLLGLFSQFIDAGVVMPAAFVIIFFLFFTYSLASTLWIYVGEVLNDQILGISCVVNMMMTVIITFTFPLAAESVGIGSCFLFFAVCMFLGTFYSAFDLIETKEKDKERILIEMKAFKVESNEDLNEPDAPEEQPLENIGFKNEIRLTEVN